MKKRYAIVMLVWGIFLCSCSKDVALGPDVEFERDYVLPQGGAAESDVYSLVPQQDFSKPWTDAELYEKYGSYFLYDFTVADLNWNQVANSTLYKLALGEPKYAIDMLNLLDEV